MPLPPNLGRRVDIVDELGEPLTAAHLGPLPEDFHEQVLSIEQWAEDAIQARLGIRYKRDPFTIPMSQLEAVQRNEINARLQNLSGMRHLLESGVGPSMNIRGYQAMRPAGQFQFHPSEFLKETVDPRILYLSQKTVRYDPVEGYWLAHSHPRQAYLSHIQQVMRQHISTEIEGRPGKTLVFDIESPSLQEEQGLWQVSARLMQGNDVLRDYTFSTRNARMRQFGEIGPNRQTLEEFLSPEEDLVDFEEGMRGFLSLAHEADYFAGHNISFDYRFLEHGILHSRLHDDPEAIDFLNKIYNPETGEIGNVLDTLHLARMHLPGLGVAPELEDAGTEFSLQNILLQTNLLRRIRDDVGDQQVADWLTRGTHYADVDVPIESYLFRYLQEMARGGTGLKRTPLRASRARDIILKSQPIGPNIPLSSLDQIHPRVVEKARSAGLTDEEISRLTPVENMVVAGRDLSITPRKYEPIENKLHPNTFATSLGRMLDRAHLRLPTRMEPEDWQIANSAGIWNRLFGHNVTSTGTIKQAAQLPSPEEWQGIQKELSEAHVPLPGLSWAERHLTATLGRAGPATGATEQMRKVFGADVAPFGRFFGSQNIQVLPSQIAKVPISLLEEWERSLGDEATTGFTQVGKKVQYLRPSFFNIGGHSEMALNVDLSQDERASLMGFLRNHELLKDNEDLLSDLEDAFDTERGIQVGLLSNLKGGNGVEGVRRAFEQVVGQGADFSGATVYLPYAGRAENGIVRTMGAILRPQFEDQKAQANIAEDIGTTISRSDRLGKLNTHQMKALFTEARMGALTDKGFTRTAMRAYSKAYEYSPIIGIGAAVAGVGYYNYRRKKGRQTYNQTLALQPAQNNPMKTAGLVQKLDNNKVNHTNMQSGADKYSYLFGTGYN